MASTRKKKAVKVSAVLEQPSLNLKAWDRQTGEKPSDYLLFEAFRDQAAPRSMRVLTYEFNIQMGDLFLISLTNKWKERVLAYDAHFQAIVDQERAEILKQTVREVDAEHMRILAAGRELAVREIAKLLSAAKQSTLSTLKPREALALVDSVVKLDRLVRGQTTENIGQDVDYSKLSDEELDMLEKIYGKAKKEVDE